MRAEAERRKHAASGKEITSTRTRGDSSWRKEREPGMGKNAEKRQVKGFDNDMMA